jgi:DNA-directed RNA polymerase, mitochondrial
MIPIATRAARNKTESTLLSWSRQCLPRPARLYSTPTSRANAPAVDAISPSLPDTYPAFLPAHPKFANSSGDDPSTSDMHTFLRSRTPYTILPTPLPGDKHSELNALYYPNSRTRDLIAVMDACLHDGYDVPRAKGIFDDLRSKRAEQILHPRLYTAFVEAYLDMALKEPEKKSMWVEDAWLLLDSLFSGQESVAVTTGSYALALLAWLRYISPFFLSLCLEHALIISQILFRKHANLHRRGYQLHPCFIVKRHCRQSAFSSHSRVRPRH